jgi:hypothetical protein
MSLERAIKKTVEYAAKFGSSINKKEIEQRLISKKVFSKQKINETIKQFPINNKKNIWIKIKIKKAKKLAKLIEINFKDILFLGISGSVASGHPKKNDDIDIFLITKKNKLWITRFKLRWFIFKNKIPHRKYGQREKGNEFCFNLWLDETSLNLPKDKQNLKNAVDLVLLKPLINKQKIYERFIRENSWAKKFVATGYFGLSHRLSIVDRRENKNFGSSLINWLFFGPQYIYMRKRIKQETVGLHSAFFHRPMLK